MLEALHSPILLQGDDRTAYRDPAVLYADGVFHLYYTLVETPQGETEPYLRLAESTSADLTAWSAPRVLSPRDRALNYSSPGSIVRDGDEWVMCVQTYCRENGEKYGNENSRLFTMRSRDLAAWSEPELLCVHGRNVARADMGRMIDPYLIRAEGSWWCFFKQNGVSYSRSADLKTWEYMGSSEAGENVCVVPFAGGYRMFSSPSNGIRVMDSHDLVHWTPSMPDLYLGQKDWPWAQGRLTAAFVMDASGIPGMPRYLMFFHGSRYSEAVEFDTNASIGLAWSEDLTTWAWPGKAAE